MFFLISGAGTKSKDAGGAVNVICPSCGALTCMHVTLLYESFDLFFIPILKWNKRYIVAAPCCGSVFELDREEGTEFEKGIIKSIDPSHLHKTSGYSASDICPHCGSKLPLNVRFCAWCGRPVG